MIEIPDIQETVKSKKEFRDTEIQGFMNQIVKKLNNIKNCESIRILRKT